MTASFDDFWREVGKLGRNDANQSTRRSDEEIDAVLYGPYGPEFMAKVKPGTQTYPVGQGDGERYLYQYLCHSEGKAIFVR